MIVYLFFTRSWSAIIGSKLFSRGYDRQSSEQNNRKLISLHNNGEDDKHAHGFADCKDILLSEALSVLKLLSDQNKKSWYNTILSLLKYLKLDIFRLETCMNSLGKVPPYSKLNFQGTNFFTQNWCNITLSFYFKQFIMIMQINNHGCWGKHAHIPDND
jgi:hypothetical protein